jgi:hypothetical protein
MTYRYTIAPCAGRYYVMQVSSDGMATTAVSEGFETSKAAKRYMLANYYGRTAKDEFEYIRDHMGVVALREDACQSVLIAQCIAYIDDGKLWLYNFTGPQTYANAYTKAEKRRNEFYGERGEE